MFSLHAAAWLVAEHGRNRIEHPVPPVSQRRLPDEWTLGLEIIAWENRRNQQQAKIHWRFSVDDARRVFRDHYQAFSSC